MGPRPTYFLLGCLYRDLRGTCNLNQSRWETMQENRRRNLLLILAVIGLVVASLSGLSEHVKWLESLCPSLSGACSEAAKVTLFHLPVWVWGIGFFSILILMLFSPYTKNRVFWLVGAGIGVEAVLVWMMVSMSWVCIFCIGNLVVISLIAVLAFERAHFWSAFSMGLLVFIIITNVIQHENHLLASTDSGKGPTGVVAKVAGEDITEAQLIMPIAGQVFSLEQQIYSAKRDKLEEIISEMVLQKEAAALGITIEELINKQVNVKEIPVSDQEVQRYYQENRPRLTEWKGTEEELMSRIRAVLQQQKAYRLIVQYAKTLEPKYSVEIYLDEPQPFLTKVNVDGSPSLGPEDVSVVVVEFSDYECPSCRQVHETVKKVREMYSGRIRWVFKDYPLKRHEHAKLAAEAAWCVKEQGKFWQYQDLLYGSSEGLTADVLERLARQAGVDPGPFRQCLDSGKYKVTIEKELQDAKKAGVDRTPTFVINGRMITGAITVDQFKQMIDEELGKSRARSR